MILLPNRLVYPELYDEQYLYNHFEECVELVDKALKGKLKKPVVNLYHDSISKWFEDVAYAGKKTELTRSDY